MHLTKQNLTNQGSIFAAGRAWLVALGNSLRIEWHFFEEAEHLTIGIDLGSEEEFIASIGIPKLVFVSFAIEQILPKSITNNWDWWDWTYGLRTAVSYHNNRIWVEILTSGDNFERNKKIGYSFSFNLYDTFLGKPKTTTTIIERGIHNLIIGDETHKVRYSVLHVSEKRPLSFWEDEYFLCRFFIKDGITVPSPSSTPTKRKEEKIYSYTKRGPNYLAGIHALRSNIIRIRSKYDGS